MEDFFNYRRRKSSIVNIGNTPLGGDNPIRIQSMANVSTMDTDAAVHQAIRMIEAGAEYVRFTAQGEREARNLGAIRKQLDEAGYIIAGEEGITETPGVFAAGDIRTKMLRQVVTAVADGANAVISAHNYLIRH